MNSHPVLLWFRNDLRLHDNPALENAINQSKINNSKVICIFILEKYKNFRLNVGSAGKWWLNESLKSLEVSLCNLNVKKSKRSINFFSGNSKNIILKICEKYRVSHVFWNRRYGVEEQNIDKEIKNLLKHKNIYVETTNGSTLVEPWNIKGKQAQRLKLFTPYKNSLIFNHKIPKPTPKPNNISTYIINKDLDLNDLKLFNKRWMKKFNNIWQVGEECGLRKLKDFFNKKIDFYHLKRDFMGDQGTSKLSPHLHFGEISPRYIWHTILKKNFFSLSEGKSVFLSEIIWREFAINLMTLYPDLDTKNMKTSFNNFPWYKNKENFCKWKNGQTGFPIIDAAMKELWETGWMHNRARMIVASFLTKHLLIPWQWGADWFQDTLVDSDFASNYASWQWVAGCGSDSAPYFRIFNPTLQSIRFDPNGVYIKKYIPILTKLSSKEIHNPPIIKYNLPYPKPIIDHKLARTRAIEHYKNLRNNIQ